MSQTRIATNPCTLKIIGALDSYVHDEEQHRLRDEYHQFRKDISRDLSPIEFEWGGVPTFEEWLMEFQNA